MSYLGALHQALRDLSRWVEMGIPPPSSTEYDILDGQVVVSPDASARHGIQPVVSLTVNRSDSALVVVGDEVALRVSAEVPPGAGFITSVEWDFDGSGSFAEREAVEAQPAIVMERRWRCEGIGTSWPVVRVIATRDAERNSAFARLQNLARVRVEVTSR